MQTRPYQASDYPLPSGHGATSPRERTQFRTDELHRWEFVLLQGAVFLAPYIAFRHPSVYITLSDIMFAGAFFLRLASREVAAPFARLTWPWVLGLLMLSGGLFIGSVFKGDVVRCLVLIGQYAFAYLLVPLVLLRRPEEEAVRLIKCCIWGMVTMCAIGGVGYLSGHYSAGGEQMAVVTGSRRLQGFAGSPNRMAVLTLMTLPLIWLLLLSGKMRTWVALICIGMLVMGIILTSSSTGIYGIFAAALIFFGGKRNFKTLIIIALLSSAAFAFEQNYRPVTFQTPVVSAMNSGGQSNADTFAARRKLNKEALKKADENVIIGMGADQYRRESRYGLPVHNLYLLLLNEGGALSLLGYLMLLGVPLLAAIAAHRSKHGKLVLVTTVTILSIFANIVMGMPHVYGRCWFLFIFLALGPALVRQGVIDPRFLPSPAQRRGMRRRLPPLNS